MSVDVYIGWDVGGAHLKLSQVHRNGQVIGAYQYVSPLWEGLKVLEEALAAAAECLPASSHRHAITTTAELVDIFPDRHVGLRKLAAVLCRVLGTNRTRFYGGRAGWIGADNIERYAPEIASANWHATAKFAATRLAEGILIDIGSTTTDIVPFRDGQPCHRGYSDFERLHHAELVYTGIVRTPVMAIVRQVPVGGRWQPLAAELFATMADVYRLTGELDERDDMQETADGAGKQARDSARRLARMLGTDMVEENGLDPWRAIARYLAEAQLQAVGKALQVIWSRGDVDPESPLVGAGAGRFLVKKLAARSGLTYTDFADMLTCPVDVRCEAARCAAAVAVAQLARLIEWA